MVGELLYLHNRSAIFDDILDVNVSSLLMRYEFVMSKISDFC